MKRLCKICNKEFEPYHWSRICCSKECSNRNRRRIKQKYKKTIKGKISNKKYKQTINCKQYDKEYSKRPYVKRKKQLHQIIYNKSIEGKTTRRKWFLNNKIKIYARMSKNRRTEKFRVWKREYIKTPKAKLNRMKHHLKRRAAKNNIIEVFTPEEFIAKVKQHNNLCPKCNKPFDSNIQTQLLTIDHNYPVSKANEDFKITGVKRIYTIDDIQPLCYSCNSSKGNKLLDNDT